MATHAEAALTFAVVMPSLLPAHAVGDRWLQTNRQVKNKGLPGWPGRRACASHVASYTAATSVAVIIVWAVFGLAITPLGFVAGQLISAVTHYWADRRFTLRDFIHNVATWKKAYYDNVEGGAEHLDQSWHLVWLFVAALFTALVGGV